LLRFGRVIFNTLIPSTSSCSFGGTSWLMELSAVTGQRINETVLDVNGDGVFNADDYAGGTPVSGMRSSVGITSTPRVISAGAREFKLQSGSDTTGTNEGVQVTTERGGNRPPRGSWRQLISR
jgi:type IV pilus assembly protein PilY1